MKVFDSGEQLAILNKAVWVDLIEVTFKQATRKGRKPGGRIYQNRRTTSAKS